MGVRKRQKITSSVNAVVDDAAALADADVNDVDELGAEDPWSFVLAGDKDSSLASVVFPDAETVAVESAGFQAALADDLVGVAEVAGTTSVSSRDGIQSLKRQRTLDPTPRKQGKADCATILKMARRAIKDENWTHLTLAHQHTYDKDVRMAVKELKLHECEAILSGCAERFKVSARERYVSSIWILSILEVCGHTFAGHTRLKKALRPLLASLSRRLGPLDQSNKVLSCLGRWRLVLALAALRGTGPGDHTVDADEDEDGGGD